MYLVGLISHAPAIEAIVAASTTAIFAMPMSRMKENARQAQDEAGSLKSTPTTSAGKMISPIHGFSFYIPPLVYLASVAACGFHQPDWMLNLGLPDDLALAAVSGLGLGVEESKAVVRIAACAGGLAVAKAGTYALAVLGGQWGAIGVRERPQIICEGPYKYLRHPLYTCALTQALLLALMFWSYVPLGSAAIMAVSFAIKMPIEEGLIERDPKVGSEYKEYKKKVTCRVIPYIW